MIDEVDVFPSVELDDRIGMVTSLEGAFVRTILKDDDAPFSNVSDGPLVAISIPAVGGFDGNPRSLILSTKASSLLRFELALK